MATRLLVRANTEDVRLRPRNGVLALQGINLRLFVENGQLVINDARQEIESRYSRPYCNFRRLVIVGSMGYITLAALRWLQDVGVTFLHIDSIGRIGAVSSPHSYDDARLRRAQALAPYTVVGRSLVRELIHRKLIGQQKVLAEINPRNVDSQILLKRYREQLLADESISPNVIESRAAKVYWRAWEAVELNFVRQDLKRIPEHWRTFGTRYSPLTSSARQAVTPANALLNYLYAILETEARLSCLIIGLDPGLGLLHDDKLNRNSFALDMVEAIRPDADRILLDLLRRHVFSSNDFIQDSLGSVRLSSQLASTLPAAGPLFRERLAPIIERVASKLPQVLNEFGTVGSIKPRTPLTMARQLRERWGQESKKRVSLKRLQLAYVCRNCGAKLVKRDRDYCKECWPAVHDRQLLHARERSIEAKRQRRLAGDETKYQRAIATLRSRATDDAELTRYVESVLPIVQRSAIAELMERTGLSQNYVSMIRNGYVLPRVKHWQALANDWSS